MSYFAGGRRPLCDCMKENMTKFFLPILFSARSKRPPCGCYDFSDIISFTSLGDYTFPGAPEPGLGTATLQKLIHCCAKQWDGELDWTIFNLDISAEDLRIYLIPCVRHLLLAHFANLWNRPPLRLVVGPNRRLVPRSLAELYSDWCRIDIGLFTDWQDICQSSTNCCQSSLLS